MRSAISAADASAARAQAVDQAGLAEELAARPRGPR